MIRHPCDPQALLDAVADIDNGWIGKAKSRTAKFVAAHKYNEKSSSAIWSIVKPAFMKLQKNKCVFCERQGENQLHGKIEVDLEHFRPKSSVEEWPNPTIHPITYSFGTGVESVSGYYWLAYTLTNYAASCKVCNSRLKSNYFPIAGPRITAPGPTAAEQAFLCYPIGDSDDDPEQLITFVGTVAVPKAKSGHASRRGQVIIDFFDLNRRELLHRERAGYIVLLGNSLLNLEGANGDDSDEEIVERLTSAEVPHTACLRAFTLLWENDRDFAKEVFKSCKKYLSSTLGTMPDGA